MLINSFTRKKYSIDALGPKTWSQFELTSAYLKDGVKEKLLGQGEIQNLVLALLVTKCVIMNKGLMLAEPQFPQ